MTSQHKTGTHPFLWQASIRPVLIHFYDKPAEDQYSSIFMTSQHKTSAHPFYIGMYIHIYTHIYVHKYTSQKECLHIFVCVLVIKIRCYSPQKKTPSLYGFIYASFVQFHGALSKTNSLTPPSSVENYYKVIFWGVPCPIESQTVSVVKSTFSKHSGYHLQTYNLQFLTHLRYLFLKALIIYLLNAWHQFAASNLIWCLSFSMQSYISYSKSISKTALFPVHLIPLFVVYLIGYSKWGFCNIYSKTFSSAKVGLLHIYEVFRSLHTKKIKKWKSRLAQTFLQRTNILCFSYFFKYVSSSRASLKHFQCHSHV